MNIQLIQGEFETGDALTLLTEMINTKIKYHENKISKNITEEDIKFRESKITKLQNELFELKKSAVLKNPSINIEASIKIN